MELTSVKLNYVWDGDSPEEVFLQQLSSSNSNKGEEEEARNFSEISAFDPFLFVSKWDHFDLYVTIQWIHSSTAIAFHVFFFVKVNEHTPETTICYWNPAVVNFDRNLFDKEFGEWYTTVSCDF